MERQEFDPLKRLCTNEQFCSPGEILKIDVDARDDGYAYDERGAAPAEVLQVCKNATVVLACIFGVLAAVRHFEIHDHEIGHVNYVPERAGV